VLGVVKNMAQLYSACDALVHPTLEDTFGMVVLEAMAHGLPVVVSDDNFCGIAASLTHEHNALIVQNPKNALELAQKIEHLFEATSYAALASHARSWAQTQSWEVLSKQQNQLYWNIVTKTRL
jgi:UDP-glucose:(heptosyl)LPS alpha-1,3-glucosyltransferase